LKRVSCYIIVLVSLFTCVSGRAQVRFTENKGQWDARVLFQSDMRNAKLFVSKGALTYLFYSAEQVHEIQHKQILNEQINVHVMKVEFLGSNPAAVYTGRNPYDDYANYYHGNNPAKWKTRVLGYNKLYITDIYDHIDFELFESYGNLKYNFIVRPGGNPSQIRMKYTGADSLYLDNYNLVMKNSLGTITELRPLVFEGPEAGNKIIESAYQLEDNILSFAISSKRNKNKPLVIDPVLVFSTYSGSVADNFGYTATFDSLGHGYAGGTVFGFGYPTTTGAFLISFMGGNVEEDAIGYIERDCGITKYSKDGKKLIYSTYLGGSLSNENPHSMIVDRNNNLLVMGSTKSADFPIGIAPAYDFTHNGESDIFVVKFSEDGTSLLGGTFVGGSSFDGLNGDRPSRNTSPLLYNYADDFRGEIIVDERNDIFVATTTNSTDFPIVNGFDNTQGGKQDGCIFQLSSDMSTLMFSSFIGGDDQDAAYGLDLGTHDDLFVTGGSNTIDFGYGVPGMTKVNNGGRADGYIVRIDRNSFRLMAMTFIGTNAYDQCYFVKTDKYGKPFVYGQTEGEMKASANVYSNAGGKMFLKKLDLNCTAIELETTFGGKDKRRPDLSPTAFLVDQCERIFISGWGSLSFGNGFNGGGTGGMPVTGDAFQKTTDNYDFYLAVFSKNFYELQYASFFGGVSNGNNNAHEHVDGGTCRFDKKGIVYHSVCAGCRGNSLFPTTAGAWSRTNNSRNCNNALFKFDFENLNRKPLARDSIYDVFATDTLDFNIDVSDPDLSDSLRVVLSGDMFKDPNYPKPLPEIETITKLPGRVNALRAHVTWRPECGHITGDTIKLYVKVYDQGCPTQDSNQALIRLVVKDPPLTVTPETFCLYFRDNNAIRLSWETFEKNKFFKYIVLYRANPNKTIVALDTLFDNQPGLFTDHLPQNPKMVNFTYYMIGYNICGKPYDRGMRINTLKEFNTPIDSTYMHYATVVENKNIRINWFTSKEDDFGSYDIFRADNINGKSTGYRKIKTIEVLTDTNYVDEDVNVAEKSYCYRIGVNDLCGHVSKPSNEGCNIVLKGEVGHLFFDLDWSPYREWKGGVKNYELFRHVDNTSMSSLVNTDLLRTHHDEDLDLWWGAYYYVVKAYESDFHGIGFNATSLSNEIRLIQPPMVFVPNAFSPNGDNVNDIWGVSHAFVREFRMQVFNRWGEKVWDNDYKGNQWDGITRGKLAMNDVFVWIVTYKGWDNRFYTQKGTVTVMP
jgi:gliding motility-associated-like protein